MIGCTLFFQSIQDVKVKFSTFFVIIEDHFLRWYAIIGKTAWKTFTKVDRREGYISYGTGG